MYKSKQRISKTTQYYIVFDKRVSPCHMKILKVNMIQTKCKHRIFLLLTQSFNHFQVRGLCEVISIYRTCE